MFIRAERGHPLDNIFLFECYNIMSPIDPREPREVSPSVTNVTRTTQYRVRDGFSPLLVHFAKSVFGARHLASIPQSVLNQCVIIALRVFACLCSSSCSSCNNNLIQCSSDDCQTSNDCRIYSQNGLTNGTCLK